MNMDRIPMTGHAIKRKQQRAISNLEIELLFMYGKEAYHGDGRVMMYLDRRAYERLERDVKRVAQKLEQLKNEYLIDSEGECVVTVGHRYRHINTK